jgi:phosphate transport system substrate-binding protein
VLVACDLAIPGLSQPTPVPVIVVVTAAPTNASAPTADAGSTPETAASTARPTAIALPTEPALEPTELPAAPTEPVAQPTNPAASGATPLCVGGSNSVLGSDNVAMTDAWVQALARRNVEVSIAGSGSEAAVEAARQGQCVDVLVLSEQLNAGQVVQLAEVGIDVGDATIFAYDAITFVTNRANPAPALSLDQIAEVLLGDVRNWSELGGAERPIRVLLRPGSGTTNYIFIEVAGFEPFVSAPDQPFPPGLQYAECGREGGNRACLEQAAATDGSFYWVTRSLVRSEGLRPIPVVGNDGSTIDPTGLGFDLDSYPAALVRPLYVYVFDREGGDADVELAAQTFRAYLLSDPGQQSIVDQGFFSAGS